MPSMMARLLNESWRDEMEKASYGDLLRDVKDIDNDDAGLGFVFARRASRSRRWFNLRGLIVAVVLFCFFIITVSMVTTKRPDFTITHYKDHTKTGTLMTNGSRPLHLLLPASSMDVNLCKTMLSTSVLGYPIPVLINWKAGHEAANNRTKLSHLKKLTGVIDYIKSLKPEQADDLVLMVDAFDMWFQLPMDVMIERYHAMNIEADNRLAKEMGTRNIMNSEGIRNTVIFASDKFCWTLKGPWCWLMPESPLPEDTLGWRTAPGRWWILNEQVLPRYLNSGFIMGPASHIRAIFERAQDYFLAEKTPLESDQHYVSMVFAEQQLYRNIVQRQLGSGAPSPITNGKLPSIEKERQGEELGHLALVPGRKYEFGIHLDYISSLTHTGIRSYYDTKFLYYNHTPVWPVPKLDPKYDCKSQVKPLPLDLVNFPGPFTALNSSDPDFNRPWSDVSLYTDICTGEIPATIHHNGDKSFREKLWPRFWMATRGRDLFNALVAKEKAVRSGVKWREGSMIEYKDAADAKEALTHGPKSNSPGGDGIGIGGALGDGGEKLSWDELCVKPGYEAELFRNW